MTANILDVLKKRAKNSNRKIIYTEHRDARVLVGAYKLAQQKYAKPIIVGNLNETLSKMKSLKIKEDFFTLVDPSTSHETDSYAQEYYEMRKEKGITLEHAKSLMREPNYFGVMLLHKGLGDALIGGASYTTAETLKPALQIIKIKPFVKLGTSFFLMLIKKKAYLFADCSLVRDPTSEELSEIAINTSKAAAYFGIVPKVAMLSYSTKGSGSGSSVDIVREATLMTKRQMPSLKIDGELQLDAAIVPEVAKLKCPDSQIKGDANVLVFPDLNSGNICYKIVERMAGATALGPFMYGFNKPINVVSRGCSVNDIFQVSIITAAITVKPLEQQ